MKVLGNKKMKYYFHDKKNDLIIDAGKNIVTMGLLILCLKERKHGAMGDKHIFVSICKNDIGNHYTVEKFLKDYRGSKDIIKLHQYINQILSN